MGVVQRQSIKQSIVTYVAMVIGALNALIVFPAVLSTEQIGLFNIIKEVAFVLAPLVFLGGGELVVRFFPVFRDEQRGHRGFLFFLICLITGGAMLVGLIFFSFRDPILTFYGNRSVLFSNYLGYLLPLAGLVAFTTMLTQYISNFQRIVVPSLFNELLTKGGLLLLALLIPAGFISFHTVFQGYIWLYVLALLGLTVYVAHLGQLHLRPDFSLLNKSLLKRMADYGLYGLVGNFSYSLVQRIDLIMLGSLATLSQTGVYATSLFVANTFDVPRNAISKVSSPLLAQHWHSGNTGAIQELYQKSALNQFIFGIGLFGAIWVSIDQLYLLMPNGEVFRSGKYIILILGMARLFDLGTGLNSEVIGFSKYYRYNLYLYAIPAISSIVGCYLLIPRYELIGAAGAVMVASVLYNVSKYVLIKRVFGMTLHIRQFFWVLLAGAAAYFAGRLLPTTAFAWLNILLKSGITVTVFGLLVWKFHLSPEINTLLNAFWYYIINRKSP